MHSPVRLVRPNPSINTDWRDKAAPACVPRFTYALHDISARINAELRRVWTLCCIERRGRRGTSAIFPRLDSDFCRHDDRGADRFGTVSRRRRIGG